MEMRVEEAAHREQVEKLWEIITNQKAEMEKSMDEGLRNEVRSLRSDRQKLQRVHANTTARLARAIEEKDTTIALLQRQIQGRQAGRGKPRPRRGRGPPRRNPDNPGPRPGFWIGEPRQPRTPAGVGPFPDSRNVRASELCFCFPFDLLRIFRHRYL